jgi:AcrR family transcriptional regulator
MQGRRKTAEKEQQIVRAAAEVFAKGDFHRVLMDDVAARAGVGKGTLYRYFPTKDDLYFATIFAGLEEIKTEIEALARKGGSTRAVLEAIATGLLRQFWPRRPLLRLLYQYEIRLRGAQGSAWMSRRGAIADAVAQVFARAATRGELGPGDPRLAAELFLGMIRSANLYRNGKGSPESLARKLTAILLDGLRNGNAKTRR